MLTSTGMDLLGKPVEEELGSPVLLAGGHERATDGMSDAPCMLSENTGSQKNVRNSYLCFRGKNCKISASSGLRATLSKAIFPESDNTVWIFDVRFDMFIE